MRHPPRRGDAAAQRRSRRRRPDPAHRKRLWTALGGPGAILAGVDVAGLWRPRQRGRTLRLEVEELRPLHRSERAELEVEAARLAVLRGAADVTVEIRTG